MMIVPGPTERTVSARFEESGSAFPVTDMTNDIEDAIYNLDVKIEEILDVSENEPNDANLDIPKGDVLQLKTENHTGISTFNPKRDYIAATNSAISTNHADIGGLVEVFRPLDNK